MRKTHSICARRAVSRSATAARMAARKRASLRRKRATAKFRFARSSNMGSREAIAPGATYAVLGALLSYPEAALLDALPEARELLHDERRLTRDARAGLDQFIDYCAQRDLITLQENYVALFDRGRATSL